MSATTATGARAGDGNLPPLPEPYFGEPASEHDTHLGPCFTADQMRDYARATLAAAPAVSAPAEQERKDAARYRWLTSDDSCANRFDEGSEAFEKIQVVWEKVGIIGPTKADLDAAIDAAMSAAPGFQAPVTGDAA